MGVNTKYLVIAISGGIFKKTSSFGDSHSLLVRKSNVDYSILGAPIGLS